MAITPADLTDPKGPATLALFPSDVAGPAATPGTLDYRLAEYIAAGVSAAGALTGASQDAAVRQYAVGRIYRAVHVRMLGESSTWSHGARSESALWSQIEAFGKLADEADAAFAALVAPAGAAAAAMAPGARSRAVELVPQW